MNLFGILRLEAFKLNLIPGDDDEVVGLRGAEEVVGYREADTWNGSLLGLHDTMSAERRLTNLEMPL